MADSCVLIPSVKTPSGEMKESKLFPSILYAVNGNRGRAATIYLKVKGDKFQGDFGHLEKDSNGELKLSSVISTGVFPDLKSDRAIKEQRRQNGFINKAGEDNVKEATLDNIRNSYQRAMKYNDSTEEYIAIPKFKLNDKGEKVVYIDVEHRTMQNSQLVDKMANEIALHNTIVAALEREGIGIGALSSLEEHQLDHGITDFTDLSRINAAGLLELIRIGKGKEGFDALPEEFSHFVIEACSDRKLVERLINYVNDEDTLRMVLGDTYDKYYKKYGGDMKRLAHEAAAKLLAAHMQKVFNSNPSEEVKETAKGLSSILSRAWNQIKEFFAGKNIKTFEDVVADSEYLYREAAKQALGGELSYDINKAAKVEWFNTSTPQSQAANRHAELLKRIIENQTKRWKIAESRVSEDEEETSGGSISLGGAITGQTAGYTRKQRLLKESLEQQMANGTFLLGVYEFIEATSKGIESAKKALDGLSSVSDGEEKSLRLRRARDFISSYSEILTDIETVLDEEPIDDDAFRKAQQDLEGIFKTMRSLKTTYKAAASERFMEFIRPYYADRPDNPFSDETMRDLAAVLQSSPKDISMFDLWLRSASNSNNEVIRMLDQVLKRARNKGRLKTIEYRKRLEHLGMMAQKNGIKDFAWMYEVDADGHKSGNYISRINYAEYDRQYNKFVEELKQKYPDIKEDPAQKRMYYNELNAWLDKYSPVNPITDEREITDDFVNERFVNMTDEERDFYNEYMAIKKELDALLPLGKTDPLGAVKIRKDFLERVLSGGKMTENVAEAIKDRFIRRGDDVDVDYEEVLTDFEGRKVSTLPIYYTKLAPGESADDLSTDAISTMIAYAAMANDYYEMNNIIHSMELGRDILLDSEMGHKVGKTKGQKRLEETLTVLGEKINKQLTKQNSNFADRLDNLYEMNLYSHKRRDEGTVGKTKLDKGKLADQLNAITALNTLALNLTAGVTNIVTGTAMLRIEAAAKEFMEYKDVLRGDRAYALAMPEFFAEFSSPVKTNKLSLFDEKFNVMQEYEGQIRNTNFDRKTWFKRMFESDTLFFMNNCGEHWLQNRTALGLAHAYKMVYTDANGNKQESNLWDALEVIPVDKENPKFGARLKIKDGYTKPDGSQFTEEDEYEFTRRCAAINERMHGIYNKEDMNVAQSVGLGRMALLFRKYLVPSVDRRWRKEAIYNYDLGVWEQGYYITAFNFLSQLCGDLKNHKLDITLSWNNLSESQRKNIYRALTEVGYFLAILGAIAIIGGSDKDRKSRSFFLNEFELQLKRQRAETGTLIPSPMLLREGLKTLKSPAASIDVMEDMLNTFGIFNPSNYTKTMQSGRYKGHTKAYKIFMTSPFVPMNSTLYKSFHPEEIIPFYNQ